MLHSKLRRILHNGLHQVRVQSGDVRHTFLFGFSYFGTHLLSLETQSGGSEVLTNVLPQMTSLGDVL